MPFGSFGYSQCTVQKAKLNFCSQQATTYERWVPGIGVFIILSCNFIFIFTHAMLIIKNKRTNILSQLGLFIHKI